MRIGIDVDETIAASEETQLFYALEYDEKYVNNHGIVNKTAYRYDEKFAWTKDEAKRFFERYFEKISGELKPKNYAKEIITALKNNGHQIYIITYRTKRFLSDPYNITKKWLEKNDIPYDVLIANSGDKGIVCQNNIIDIFIDDSVDQCRDVHSYGIKTYLFDAYHNQHNKDLPRVMNWLEIYELIEGEKYHG